MGTLLSCLRNLKRSACELRNNVKEIKVTLCSVHQLLSGMVGLVKDVEEISQELRLTVTNETSKAKQTMSRNLELVLSQAEEELHFHLAFYDDITKLFEDFLEKIYGAEIRTPTKLVVVSETVTVLRDGFSLLRADNQSPLKSNLLSALAFYVKSRSRESRKEFLTKGTKPSSRPTSQQGLSWLFCFKNSFINRFNEQLITHLHEKTPHIQVQDVEHFLRLKNKLKNGYPKFANTSDFRRRKEYLEKMKVVLSRTMKTVKKWNSTEDLLLLAKIFDIDLNTAAEKMQATEKSFHDLQAGIVTSLKQIRGRQQAQLETETTFQGQEAGSSFEDDIFSYLRNEPLASRVIDHVADWDLRDLKERIHQYLRGEKIDELLAVVGNNLDLLPSILGESELEGILTRAVSDHIVDNVKRRRNTPSDTPTPFETGDEVDVKHPNSLQELSPIEDTKEQTNEHCNDNQTLSVDDFPQENGDPSSQRGLISTSAINGQVKELEIENCVVARKENAGASTHNNNTTRSKDLQERSIFERLIHPNSLANIIKLSIFDLPKSAIVLQQFKDKGEIVQITAKLVAPLVSDLMSSNPKISKFYAEDGKLQTLTANTVYELLKVLEEYYKEDDCLKKAAKETAKKQLLLPLCRYLKQITLDNVLE